MFKHLWEKLANNDTSEAKDTTHTRSNNGYLSKSLKANVNAIKTTTTYMADLVFREVIVKSPCLKTHKRLKAEVADKRVIF